jgi:hypothetical protein
VGHRCCAYSSLDDSINELVRAIDGPRTEIYIRSAALFDQVRQRLEAQNGGVADDQLAVRDFKLIDEAMAGFPPFRCTRRWLMGFLHEPL